MITPITGRNAPCPCGSGKRYKDCHGALTATDPTRSIVAPDIDALLARAQAALGSGDAAQAETAWRQAIALDPENAQARFHLGNLYRERGEIAAAIAEYELALRTAPDHAAVLNNLGLALEGAGQRQRALDCYAQVLAADPAQADALGNLANAQFERKQFDACAQTYDRLFAIRRELPVPVLLRRAIALQKCRRLEDAEAIFRDALSRTPDDAQILANIGSLCVEQGRYGDADAPLSRAIELDPANAYALSMLAHARAQRCAWDGIGSLFDRLQRLLDAGDHDRGWSVAPFPLLAMPLPPRTQRAAARSWAGTFRQPATLPPPEFRDAPDGRLRVGFVSSDFRSHPVAMLMMEVWERIDRNRFETFGYGIMPTDAGPVGQRIAGAFEHFTDVSALVIRAAAQRIRDDGIAVLFDLNGYTQNARPELFALRPAPVQINSMGFPGTLGAEWYDYIHVDPFVAPEAAQPDYSERFFPMPDCYVPSDTTRMPSGAAPQRRTCGLPDDAFVFCCFNNTYKILPEVFAIWMRLLAAVPKSVLWLLEANADATHNLRIEMHRAGLAPERLVFAPRVPNAEHLARNAVADLFVDTSPYGAHTTSNDALLAGLPVLTCAGETLASRNPGSQLRAIGLPEMVTTRLADYESLALRLAHNRPELAAIRSRLEANRATHPLFDMARYTRNLEDALTRIRHRYATGVDAASR